VNEEALTQWGMLRQRKKMRTKGAGHVALMGEYKNVLQNLYIIFCDELYKFSPHIP
jgi:hypothetical protein